MTKKLDLMWTNWEKSCIASEGESVGATYPYILPGGRSNGPGGCSQAPREGANTTRAFFHFSDTACIIVPFSPFSVKVDIFVRRKKRGFVTEEGRISSTRRTARSCLAHVKKKETQRRIIPDEDGKILSFTRSPPPPPLTLYEWCGGRANETDEKERDERSRRVFSRAKHRRKSTRRVRRCICGYIYARGAYKFSTRVTERDRAARFGVCSVPRFFLLFYTQPTFFYIPENCKFVMWRTGVNRRWKGRYGKSSRRFTKGEGARYTCI